MITFNYKKVELPVSRFHSLISYTLKRVHINLQFRVNDYSIQIQIEYTNLCTSFYQVGHGG